MIDTPLTRRALELARAAHQGQVDKAGVPYLHHPRRLAEGMPDEITTCVALLHDVLEDTPVTLAQLERDFPPEVTQAVARLTRPAGMDYFAYVASLKDHPIARLVKQADLAHNSDESRLAALPPEERARLREKYARAKAILED